MIATWPFLLLMYCYNCLQIKNSLFTTKSLRMHQNQSQRVENLKLCLCTCTQGFAPPWIKGLFLSLRWITTFKAYAPRLQYHRSTVFTETVSSRIATLLVNHVPQKTPVASGVARTSPMLGHSMGTLRLYEILREVQKH